MASRGGGAHDRVRRMGGRSGGSPGATALHTRAGTAGPGSPSTLRDRGPEPRTPVSRRADRFLSAGPVGRPSARGPTEKGGGGELGGGRPRHPAGAGPL